MANDKWLYCSDDWFDLINIIKLEKNPEERLREFYRILGREDLTIADVIAEWAVVEKDEIELCVEDWFYDDDDLAYILGNNGITYWFFNICTGEAIHINYHTEVTHSNMIAS